MIEYAASGCSRMRSVRTCRASSESLPTRLVVTEDWPHPPVELVTVAAPGASVVLAGRALSVPVAPVSDGVPRTTAVGRRRIELCHKRSIPRSRTARIRLPSSEPSGPHRGHIRATNDRTAAENTVITGRTTAQFTEQTRPSGAGRRALPRIPDTEEVIGSTPVAPKPGSAAQSADQAV